MDSLHKAIRLLHDGEALTCVALLSDGSVYTSRTHGIAPLLQPISEQPAFFRGATVADRVIGKSAALLLQYSGAAAVYGDVVSDLAATCLEKAALPFSAGVRTDYIRNRTGDGMCPMEQSVLTVHSPPEAVTVLTETYRKLVSEKSD